MTTDGRRLHGPGGRDPVVRSGTGPALVKVRQPEGGTAEVSRGVPATARPLPRPERSARPAPGHPGRRIRRPAARPGAGELAAVVTLGSALRPARPGLFGGGWPPPLGTSRPTRTTPGTWPPRAGPPGHPGPAARPFKKIGPRPAKPGWTSAAGGPTAWRREAPRCSPGTNWPGRRWGPAEHDPEPGIIA